MSLKEMLGIRVLLVYCPLCSRIKKHNKWVILTVDESQKLSNRFKGFDLQPENCIFCKQEQTLGAV